MPEWTEDTIERLRALWRDPKLSCATIGGRLGGFSKAAIAGKVHRLNLPPRASPISQIPAPPRKSEQPHRPKTVPTLDVPRDGWTQAADDLLTRLWPDISLREIGAQLGSTKDAVRSRGARIGLPMKGPDQPVALTAVDIARLRVASVRQPIKAPVPLAIYKESPRRQGDGCQWTDSVRHPWVFCGKPVCLHPRLGIPTAWCATHYRRVYQHRAEVVAA